MESSIVSPWDTLARIPHHASNQNLNFSIVGPSVISKLKSAQPVGVITKTLEWLRFAPLIADGNRSERGDDQSVYYVQ